MSRWTLLSNTEIRELEQAPNALPDEGFLWVDAQLDEGLAWTPAVERLLGKPIDELHLEDLANPLHPSHFDNGDGYSVLIIRSLSSKPLFDDFNRLNIRTRPCYFLIADRLLVTYRSKDSRTFEKARAFAASCTQAPRADLEQFLNFKKLPACPDELAVQIVSNLVDRFLETRADISDRLDRWQRDLLNPRKRFEDWNALLAARNELNRFEAVAQDQRDALVDFEDDRQREHSLSPALQVNLRDTMEHLERIIGLTQRLGSNTEAAVQLHFSATAHKTNEIVTVLTMLTAIFMPLTLITGLFGMNFENMPFLHHASGFWISVGLMAISAGISALIIVLIRGRQSVKR
ncbi:magnesium transporter CorA family protein [Limnobacter sp.]|uniref:magnesium transporter CorA family protein n=1 Tax=Limnobacter sp. TaxID=2003368 RepID=UPI0035174C12